jgi:isoleucyl-tRNA synthetase
LLTFLQECHVGEDGAFSATCRVAELVGKNVLDEQVKNTVISSLGELVFHVGTLVHSYPYDWRSKTPTILRASSQWFFDTGRVRSRALVSTLVSKCHLFFDYFVLPFEQTLKLSMACDDS